MVIRTPDSRVKISHSKAVEIIMAFSSKNNSFYDKAERYLLNKGIIEDCVPYNEYEEAIETLDSSQLTELIELI